MIGLLVLASVTATTPDKRCAARVEFYQPAAGVVSTPLMAASVAKLYLEQIYGADVIRRELPLQVSRTREVWHVRGGFQKPGFLKTAVGGVAEIDLCQSTGQVLRISHGK
ncbi:MAG TPA: NTF2 fold immunity protein [Sphingomonas sp.]|uniref:NTF2 fold immunity protein n=1 Tax=Sphingomonas sp. TaxID=28214 RepID=UPI002BD868B5|nr:NTF2 fold immunity protein [Sphingomonas sp.]HMI19282.1 NTF2 fold immunity protein [Sphingomonas sp.]